VEQQAKIGLMLGGFFSGFYVGLPAKTKRVFFGVYPAVSTLVWTSGKM